MTRPVVSSTTPLTPLLDARTGLVSREWIKWFQGVQQTVNEGFDSNGVYQGVIGTNATFSWRSATIQDILANIDDSGIVTAAGIDFARAYLNKDTDHIADGTGSPLAGGEVAFAAFVTSGPAAGQMLVFNGANWLPHAKATTKAAVAHKWLSSYDDATGFFTQSQPDFTDLSGQADITQMPASGISGTVPLAKITGLGADGSLTFVNGIITAFVSPT